jgi:hypothetical protein
MAFLTPLYLTMVPLLTETRMHDIFYNTTNRSTVPPSELLFNRVIKGKLPVINSKKIVNRDIKKLETMKKHDKNATENMQIKGETQEK